MIKKLNMTDMVVTWIVSGAMTVLYFTRAIPGWFAAVVFLILLMVIFAFRIFIIFITRD